MSAAVADVLASAAAAAINKNFFISIPFQIRLSGMLAAFDVIAVAEKPQPEEM